MRFSAILSLALAGIASSHTVITYPGWRGDNLKDNDEYPFGMQWEYPCECPPRATPTFLGHSLTEYSRRRH